MAVTSESTDVARKAPRTGRPASPAPEVVYENEGKVPPTFYFLMANLVAAFLYIVAIMFMF